MRGKGISYDSGFIHNGTSSREPFDPEVVRGELRCVRDDLHCTAVRVVGGDPRRWARSPTATVAVRATGIGAPLSTSWTRASIGLALPGRNPPRHPPGVPSNDAMARPTPPGRDLTTKPTSRLTTATASSPLGRYQPPRTLPPPASWRMVRSEQATTSQAGGLESTGLHPGDDSSL